MTHEIGHMFGIKHCQWLSCVMQGSNHMEESDRRPLDFCPVCLRKLQDAIGFDIAERYAVRKSQRRRSDHYRKRNKLEIQIKTRLERAALEYNKKTF